MRAPRDVTYRGYHLKHNGDTWRAYWSESVIPSFVDFKSRNQLIERIDADLRHAWLLHDFADNGGTLD